MAFHHAIYTANVDLSHPIPWGRTPEKTDGTCILAEVFTVPAGARVLVRFLGQVIHKNSDDAMVASLFIDDQLFAVRTAAVNATGAGYFMQIALEYCHVPNDGLPHTYRVHVGPNGGALTLNGMTNAPGFGATMAATLTLEEK